MRGPLSGRLLGAGKRSPHKASAFNPLITVRPADQPSPETLPVSTAFGHGSKAASRILCVEQLCELDHPPEQVRHGRRQFIDSIKRAWHQRDEGRQQPLGTLRVRRSKLSQLWNSLLDIVERHHVPRVPRPVIQYLAQT